MNWRTALGATNTRLCPNPKLSGYLSSLKYVYEKLLKYFLQNIYCTSIRFRDSKSTMRWFTFFSLLPAFLFVITCTMNYMFQEIISKNIQTKKWLTINLPDDIHICFIFIYYIEEPISFTERYHCQSFK